MINSYFPFKATPEISSTYTITAQNIGNQNCPTLILAFFSGAGANLGTTQVNATSGVENLPFEIATASGQPNVINSGRPPNLTTLGQTATIVTATIVAPGATRAIPFVVRVPAGTVVPSGDYTANLTAAVYYPNGSNIKFGSSTTVAVTIHVSAEMSVNIAGGSSLATTLAFGNMIANDVRAVDIQARSNQGFKFTATSDNGGVLKLDPNPGDGVNWQVPYTVKINNGAPLNLSTAQSVAISSAATSLAGVNVPVQVTLGNPAGQRAGTYKDVITVKIEANP
ncbi:MAG: hypothetical protein R3D44_16255 [Hyphomicrobiaceae bacterium]